MNRRTSLIGATALALLPLAAFAQSKELVLYCSVGEEWCRAQSEAFTRETGINVLMTRKSSGETFAQIKAEAGQPRGDIWWGGTGDPHLQAAQEGLTEEYRSPMLTELQPWAVAQAETSGFRTVGIYAGALGFGYNATLVTENPPACWKDLLDPRFRDDIQVANPNSSGTSYTMLATMVQLLGEDEAFAYLGAPIVTVAPCEGTGYEVGSMSIIKGGPNPDAAKAWYDWALSAKAQEIGASVNSFQVPSNKSAATPPQAPKLDQIKLIDYDFAKYGSSEVRTALLARWDAEIGALPK
ncbi:MAG: ABC transporter substrate-binding protein [Rhodobacterales bacterium]|nr:ABC transporter substrate-binding protein [Rhodobacterales bacterium]